MPDYNSGKVQSLASFMLENSQNDHFALIYVFLFKFIYFFLWQLEVQYFHDHATLTTAVALNQSPAIDVSATIGTPSIAFGAEAGYDTTTGNFTKYTAGLSVAKPESSASIIL